MSMYIVYPGILKLCIKFGDKSLLNRLEYHMFLHFKEGICK